MATYDASVNLGGLFPDSDDSDREPVGNEETISTKTVGGVDIVIREYGFSSTNANFVWPASAVLGDYLVDNVDIFRNKKIIELGSATGILSILAKKLDLDCTSSDYDDPEIADNIKRNSEANFVALEHIPHTWGNPWPWRNESDSFDIVLGADILLYIKEYPNLIKTLVQIFERKPGVVMFMAWRRRLKGHQSFFDLAEEAGFSVDRMGQGMYTLKLNK